MLFKYLLFAALILIITSKPNHSNLFLYFYVNLFYLAVYSIHDGMPYQPCESAFQPFPWAASGVWKMWILWYFWTWKVWRYITLFSDSFYLALTYRMLSDKVTCQWQIINSQNMVIKVTTYLFMPFSGHFGYIKFPIPIYHPDHVSELKRMLSLLCLKCLKLKKNKVLPVFLYHHL